MPVSARALINAFRDMLISNIHLFFNDFCGMFKSNPGIIFTTEVKTKPPLEYAIHVRIP